MTLIDDLAPPRAAGLAGADAAALLPELTRLVAEATRYPLEILEPHADFEHDLGIDSVKLGEILVIVRRHFEIPEDAKIVPQEFRTLSNAADAVARLLRSGASPVATTQSVPTLPVTESATVAQPPQAPRGRSTEEFVQLLTDVVAEATRYPREILEPQADFEHDLGIDSVKLGEIVVVMRKRLELPETLKLPVERFRSIEKAAQTLAEMCAPTLAQPAQVEEQREVTEPLVMPSVSAKPFAGKVVLITGSGRGIGRNLALHFASLGASVVVNAFHSRDAGEATTQEIVASGGDAHFVWGSIANERHREGIFAEIEQRYGRLDYYIGNASNGLIAEFEQIKEEDWEKGFRTNVIGLQQSSVLAARLMARNGGGTIITMSSSASHRHIHAFGCMAALKCAVESLTRTMAVEFAKYNVKVMCISAGPVEGDLITKFPDSDAAIRHWRDLSIGNRLVSSEEIAHLAAFILSGVAPSLNGTVIVMDNGMSYAI